MRIVTDNKEDFFGRVIKTFGNHCKAVKCGVVFA